MLPNEAVNYYHTLFGHRIVLYSSVVWVWIRSEFRAGWECFVSSWSKGLSCWDVPSVFNWAKSQRPDVKCFQTLKSLTWISVIRIIFPICIVFSLEVSACGDSVCSLVIGCSFVAYFGHTFHLSTKLFDWITLLNKLHHTSNYCFYFKQMKYVILWFLLVLMTCCDFLVWFMCVDLGSCFIH